MQQGTEIQHLQEQNYHVECLTLVVSELRCEVHMQSLVGLCGLVLAYRLDMAKV